ncbi:hypothetical protein PhCBS80983_g05462 [Powellomyces hirtus]|uniref:p22-phox n=1 Tax=Powellomyces hirtus TaxID=109895 RepID=A0A507DU44_9FUNG|nr:hypothetical protein DFJ77DRAFT_437734 [Powellomyces hirtus]TPX55269.1 hypothetical protein PhCBS80983_g05462 [Powellomyces hirtus]
MSLGKFDWYPWARYQGIGSGFFILTGGVIAMFYPNVGFAVINVIVGLLLMAWNWPIVPFTMLGPVSSNMWIRAVGHAAAIFPTILQAPTITGGLCLIFATLTFLRAAVNGEKWEPPKKKGKGGRNAGGGAGKDMSAVKAPEN